MKGGVDSWGWEEIVTTKDAEYTDGDISVKVQDAEAIEFRIPDKDFPLIHVALRDLETLCIVCGESYCPNWSVQDKERCGPCYNHGGKTIGCIVCGERVREDKAKGLLKSYCEDCYAKMPTF